MESLKANIHISHFVYIIYSQNSRLKGNQEKQWPVFVVLSGHHSSHRPAQPSDVALNALDAITVVVQYRLGLFGFTRIKHASQSIAGNQGLLDIVLALRWVRS